MKKVGDLMKEMGFNPKSQDSVKEAFVKHLIKAATGVDVITPSEKKSIQDNPQKIHSLKKQNPFLQMSFDFKEVETTTEEKKKVGT